MVIISKIENGFAVQVKAPAGRAGSRLYTFTQGDTYARAMACAGYLSEEWACEIEEVL